MKTIIRSWAAIGLMLCLALTSETLAGTFKRITIDGSFADWAGVPVAVTDDEGDMTGSRGGFDIKEVYVANDEQYVYLRVVLYTSSTNTDYNAFHHRFFIDSDNNFGTGFPYYGLGSEMLIEDAGGYSERYGTWNDGAMTGLSWAQAPSGPLPNYQYEARFSRAVRDVQLADVPAGSGNPERDLPLFTQDSIAMAFEVADADWGIMEAGTMFWYDLAPVPAPFTGTQTLADLTTANWRVNDAGTDLGTEWLGPFYDDTQPGWNAGTGLFGFNAPSGVYPVPVNTTLASGASAYYFRVPFTWNNDQSGVGLMLSNYLSAGAVFYLNGAEVGRVRMPAGTITYSTPATGGPSEPGTAELVDLSTTALVVGDNILEVEVHPAAGATSLVFGTALIASDNFPPRILDADQPADRNVTEGESTTFNPGALAGTQPFTYQWFKGTEAIPSATNATFTIDAVTVDDAGSYSVEITNPKGLKTTSRAAVLTTTPVEVAITDANLPADITVNEGTSATFTVEASGSLLEYQWLRDGEAIPGEVGPDLVLNDVAFSESGKKFSVVVSNRVNSVTSREATLTVLQDRTPPGIASVTGVGQRVTVTFSEPVDPASAEVPSNYSLDPSVQVQNAVVDPNNQQRVSLTTAQQSFGQVYTLTVAGVKDRFGNAASGTALFRSTISIDGSFDDWNDVPVALTLEQINPGTVEFKDISITNDNDYLYLRFSFYSAVGPLNPVQWDARANHWDIIIDTDQDNATGTWSGGDVLIEDAAGDNNVFRLAGGWTQGTFTGVDVDLQPGDVPATDFELRISRHAIHRADGLPIFPGPAIDVFMVIQSLGWSALDQTGPEVPLTFFDFPPLPTTPGPLSVRLVDGKVEITWPGEGVLESRTSLATGDWETVTGATSGIQIDPSSSPSSFYRLRL